MTAIAGMANAARLKSLVRASLESGASSECGLCEILKGRNRDRGYLMRVTDVAGGVESVIVKAWRVRNLKERAQAALRLSMARREWRAHQHLEGAGVPVPRLLDFFRVRCRDGRRFEAMIVQDLGRTTNGLVHLKELLAAGDEAAVRRFEDRVVDLTAQLLRAGVVDVDHQLRNIVLNGSEMPIRIDFECARRFSNGAPPANAYSGMIGRLVVSHAYACQPDLDRTERFAIRLAERLQPSREVLYGAAGWVSQALKRQRVQSGIASTVALDW